MITVYSAAGQRGSPGRRGRVRTALLWSVVAAVVVTGCGGDDDQSSAETESSRSRTTAVDAPATTGGATTQPSETPDRPTPAAGPTLDSSVLPDAIVQPGDPNVVVATPSEQTVADAWLDTFAEEQAAYEEAGFSDGVAVDFNWNGFDADDGGFSAAHLFADPDGAAAGLIVVDAWHRDKTQVTFREPLIEDLVELEADIGDESIAYLQGNIVNDTMRGQGVVVLWRTGNVVHTLRIPIAIGTPDESGVEVQNVITLAEAIDARM